MIFKFSVVIPLYNKANYIIRALNSVIAQELSVDEIIIVDDGSTDDGVKLIKSLNLQHLTIIKQANQGVSSARNNGIESCRNDWVLLLDADDIWLPKFTLEIAALAGNYPTAGILACAYAFKEGNKITPAHLKYVPNNKGLLKNYFSSCIKADLPITASSVALNKSAFKHAGKFPIDIAMGEDQILWSRITYKYPIAYSNNICVYYDRSIADSACKTNIIIDIAPHVKLWQDDLEQEKVPKELIKSLHKLMHFSVLYCVKNNLVINNKTKARSILLKNSMLYKDIYWLVALFLSYLPSYIIKRIL